MATSNDVDYLLQRAKQEARKAREAFERQDNPVMVMTHRELAVMYQARALRLSESEGLTIN